MIDSSYNNVTVSLQKEHVVKVNSTVLDTCIVLLVAAAAAVVVVLVVVVVVVVVVVNTISLSLEKP